VQKYRYTYELTDSSESTFCFETEEKRARIDFLDNDLYRVAMWKKGDRMLPTWSVSPDDYEMPREGRDRLSGEGFPMYKPEVTITDYDSLLDSMGNNRRMTFTVSGYELTLYLPRFSFELRTEDGKVLMADRPYSPYNYSGELGEGSGHFLVAERYEEIFGLGEKSGNVNRFGRSFTIGARDAMGYDASSSDPLYKHLPYYICRNSVGTYGIYYDTHARGTMNFMEEMDNYYGHFKSFTSDDDVLVYYVFLGDIKSIVKRFSRLCGRSVFSPKWTVDYNGSTMAYTDADNAGEQLLSFLNKCRTNNIKCSGFYLSSGYTSIGPRRYVFNWNTDKIPDPKQLIKTFHDNGVHFIPNIKPAFLEDHPMYDEIAKNGWFLHYSDGTPAKMPFWDGYGSFLDFTNPGAFDFWTRMAREKLIDYGMDALWNDNNEYYMSDREIMADGFGNPVPAYRICQVFPMLMVMASGRAFYDGDKRYMMSTRSGGAGINRLAQTWTGDNYTSFKDLHYNHKMLMGMSLSGMPLVGHDIGGFAGPAPEEELFFRWLQYGVLLPRFCIHSWNDGGSATEPWMYPDRLFFVQRLYAFRNRISPYLYQQLYRVHNDFDTFITPVFLDYPHEDPESDLFLVGHDLLAACIFHEGGEDEEVCVHIPEGTGWYVDYETDAAEEYYDHGDVYFGCQPYSVPVILHRAGSVFVENVAEYSADSDMEEIQYRIYAPEEGSFSYEYYEDDGITKCDVNTQALKYTVSVTCTDLEILVSGVPFDREVVLVDRLNRKLRVLGD